MNQIILMQLWCGMHRTCKNTSVKPDRSSWKIRSEKLFEGSLSTSLLDESNHSDAARSSSIDHRKFQIATTVQKWNENRIDLPVLGLAGCHDNIEMKSEANPEQQVIITWQVHADDQSVLPGVLAKSFAGQSFASPLCPHAICCFQDTEK